VLRLGGSFSGIKQLGGMNLTSDHLVLSLRMSGTIPLLLFYAFMACSGTTLPLDVTYSL